ncbi:MAG: DUF5058 family protein [Clostridia bacterium]
MPKSFISIYILGGIIAACIICMSIYFIIKAIRRAKVIGMDMGKVKETIKNSAIFAIVPSIPIVIGIGIMMQYLGLAVPWIRLTVIGALQYELIAMDQVGITTAAVLNETIIATAVIVMTLSILAGPIFNAIFYKKYQGKLADLQKKNGKKMDTITGALLGGLLSGMLSAILVGGIFTIGSPTIGAGGVQVFGEITLITLGASVLLMGICGLILVLGKQKWIESYALPITILGSLGIAYAFIPLFA